jgi:hypothetical protein
MVARFDAAAKRAGAKYDFAVGKAPRLRGENFRVV